MSEFTTYLFAVPSSLSGWARTLDIAGQFDWYNYSRTPQAADANAIASDWLAIGSDLKEAVLIYGGAPTEKRQEMARTSRATGR
jgi:hypothetical protein